MFPESDLLPISALQHLAFCERQWALIHLEQVWRENRLTVEGRHLHERVDAPGRHSRGKVRTARSLRLHSLRLGLSGMADVVEFHRVDPPETPPKDPPAPPSEHNSDPANASQSAPTSGNRDPPDAPRTERSPEDCGPQPGIRLKGVSGLWRPFPVEYKRGKPKKDHCDEVQICAQALCLEEMLRTPVPEGALFYGRKRRRTPVRFDRALRAETEALIDRLHAMHRAARTPPAKYEKKCDRCSLYSVCMPKTTDGHRSARAYIDRAIREGIPVQPE